MLILGHHTCSSTGNIHEIQEQGPFLSEHFDDDTKNHKFLGTGYYFWDNNIKMAHSHGQKNYKRRYFIFEAEIKLKDDIFLDLAGNRKDMLNFQEIMNKLKELNSDTEQWTLGHFIEFLKSKNKFPYRAIRAIDTSINPKEILKFVPDRSNYINLNPIFIVCLADKSQDIIQKFEHIKTFP